MKPKTAARLANSHIQLVSETERHYVFTRGNLVALAERGAVGFGSIGSTGVMTENGLAYVVWRDGCALLKAKTVETVAASAQLEAIHQFSEDLKNALAGEE